MAGALPVLHGDLCFNVQGLPEYSGNNGTGSGRDLYWKAGILLDVEGESKGRDLFEFRVVDPKVTDNHIEYRVEWSLEGDWQPMQDVSINRFSGWAVRRFNTDHGGETYQCRGEERKF